MSRHVFLCCTLTVALAASAATTATATDLSAESLSSVGRVGSSVIKDAFSPRGERIYYETTTEAGEIAPVTGTLYDAPGAKGLIVLAPGTRGMGDHCAPSNGHAILSSEQGTSVNIDYERFVSRMLLDAGYRVIVTDYVGLGTPGTHTYLNRIDQGHAVIDAAKSVAKKDEKVAFWGYSQGGGAAAAAAELVADYAPELNVVATFSGAPPADPLAVLEQASAGMISAVAGFAAVSYATTYPDFREALEENLNEDGVDVLRKLSNSCIVDAIALEPKPFSAYTKNGMGLAELAHSDERLSRRLEQNKLGKVPVSMPTMVLVTPDDDLVPAPQATQLVRDYCALGAPVEYRSVLVPGTASAPLSSGSSRPVTGIGGGGHAAPLALQTEHAIGWLDDRFANKPFTQVCPKDTDGTILLEPDTSWNPLEITAITLGVLASVGLLGAGVIGLMQAGVLPNVLGPVGDWAGLLSQPR